MTGGRGRAMRETRRSAMFNKFRLVELNLVPLVDTFVAIVFFSLTAATVGELAPVLSGVTLPESRIGVPAHQELTLGVASRPAQLVFNGKPLMSVQTAASQASNNPAEPLLLPTLFTAMKSAADSIRQSENIAANESVQTPLAIQGDRSMRYDLLERLLQTARLAGFRNITLQVRRTDVNTNGTPASTTSS